MSGIRFFCLIVTVSLLSAPAFAKTDEDFCGYAIRKCGEAGIPLKECSILSPNLIHTCAGEEPPERSQHSENCGWCPTCTSYYCCAPVTDWASFAGEQRTPLRDEDVPNRTSPTSTDSPSPDPTDGGNEICD